VNQSQRLDIAGVVVHARQVGFYEFIGPAIRPRIEVE